ncbi:MAG TPA: peptidoglycan recognition family protein [Blastocatellia bacterium]|nr:peptidoglycan recognition family protein [Blastocatellia bacterium]
MQEINPQNLRNAKLVDRYSRYIKSPILRLKFLQSAMKIVPPDGFIHRLPVVGTLQHRALLIVELSKVLPVTEPAPLALRMTALLYRLRYGVYAACLVFALAVGMGLGYAVMSVAGRLFVSTEAKGAGTDAPGGASANANVAAGEAVASIGTEAGLTLDKVWLAEQGSGYEFYSNGARVLTEYETAGGKRDFYRFPVDRVADGADEGERLTRPLGIVYHISEGDQLPFDNEYNASLQTHSKALLEYARGHRLYNYVIDRFGRVYRVVRDEEAASHAGNSAWSDGRDLYLNLNASFIGVCFEGQSRRGKAVGADGINETQIYAARQLTAVLRSKYQIADANCVTHGLVSVNPSNKLMGYHTDWVTGFPFAAIGLTDKYETEIAAISRLGFSYDAAYLSAAGGQRWPGLDKADQALRDAARQSGAGVEEKRRALQEVYERLYAKQRALDKEVLSAE